MFLLTLAGGQVEGPLGFLNKDSMTASRGFGNTVPIERVPVVSCPM